MRTVVLIVADIQPIRSAAACMSRSSLRCAFPSAKAKLLALAVKYEARMLALIEDEPVD